jgi:hypothetical protein
LHKTALHELHQAMSTERRRALMQQIVDRGEASALPPLLGWLSPDYEEVLARACHTLLQPLPPSQLAWLEPQLRRWYPADAWQRLDRASLLRTSRLPYGRWLTAAISCHRNGHLRELALRQLSQSPPEGWEPAFYLVRVNDWVEPVRAAARQALLRFSPWQPHHATLFPLLDRLRQGQRGDPGLFVDQLEQLLIPEALPAALCHPQAQVRRSALGVGLKHGQTLLVQQALDDPALEVVTRALRLLRPLPLPDTFWRPWLHSRKACVRLEAHRKLAARLSEREWQPALFDKSPAVQELACYHLRQHNPVEVYRQALSRGVNSQAAIRGLAALGQGHDLTLLSPLWKQARAGILRQLIAASARLGGEECLELWLGCLQDSRAGVARQAGRALQPYAGRLLGQWLQLVHDEQCPLHSREMALELAERGDKWGSLPVLLQVADTIEALRPQAQKCLRRWLLSTNRRQQLPSAEQWKKCGQALAGLTQKDGLVQDIERVVATTPLQQGFPRRH